MALAPLPPDSAVRGAKDGVGPFAHQLGHPLPACARGLWQAGGVPGQQPRDAGEGHPTLPHKDEGTLCIGLHVCRTPRGVGTLARPLQRRGRRYKRGWDLPKVTGRKWQSWAPIPWAWLSQKFKSGSLKRFFPWYTGQSTSGSH